jgi:hypothetical protein
MWPDNPAQRILEAVDPSESAVPAPGTGGDMNLRSLLALGAAASLAACESEAPASSVELLDSAGVTVVLNPPPGPATPAFHLSDEPIVVIGDTGAWAGA